MVNYSLARVMIRLILVFIVIAIGVRFSFRHPFYALLFYVWNAYFRPESWVWSELILSMNLSFTIGAYAVLATLLSGEKLVFGREALLLAAVLVQSLLSTMLSLDFAVSWPSWILFSKVLLICYLMTVLVTTEERLRWTLVIMAFSLAFEGAKQGWTQLILSPGVRNDNSSPMLGDNNGIGVGMLMLVPLLVALARTSTWRPERYAARFLIVGVVYRAISTYSRGAFLAAFALAFHMLALSKRRIRATIGVAAVATTIYFALPAEFWERMDTIPGVNSNGATMEISAASRIHFWRVAIDMANDRPLYGIGHNAFNGVFDRYDFLDGLYGRGRSVHSSWFGALAELGYPGLVLLLLVFITAFWSLLRVRIAARGRTDMARLAVYATAIEAALVVFVIGGTFLPFQYNEMIWHLLTLSMICWRLASNRLAGVSETSLATAELQPPLRTGVNVAAQTLTPRSARPTPR